MPTALMLMVLIAILMVTCDGRSLVRDPQLKLHQVARSYATAFVARFSVENDCLLWKAMSKTVVGSVLFRESVQGSLAEECWEKCGEEQQWRHAERSALLGIPRSGHLVNPVLGIVYLDFWGMLPVTVWAPNLVPGLPAPVWGKEPLYVVRRCFGCSPPLKQRDGMLCYPKAPCDIAIKAVCWHLTALIALYVGNLQPS